MALPTGWPYTTRDYVYGINVPVPAANLNAIQDRIVDLHRVKTAVFFNGVPELLGAIPTALPGWIGLGGSSSAMRWRAQSSICQLAVPIDLPVGARIYKAEIKHYNAATGIMFDLCNEDLKFATAASAPTVAVLGTVTPGGTGSGMSTIDLTATPHTIGAEEKINLIVKTPDAGDDFYGVRITYVPILPT